jgi:hypothetical protein
MREIFQQGYGPPDDVLVLRDLWRPGVSDDNVLIRVHWPSSGSWPGKHQHGKFTPVISV